MTPTNDPDLMGKALEWLGLLAPPAVGAFVGLRYAQAQTLRQRGIAFGTSFALAIYVGPAIAELLTLGPKATVAVGILVAIIGTELIGVLVAAALQFKNDPAGTFKRWIDAWLGRGQ